MSPGCYQAHHVPVSTLPTVSERAGQSHIQTRLRTSGRKMLRGGPGKSESLRVEDQILRDLKKRPS